MSEKMLDVPCSLHDKSNPNFHAKEKLKERMMSNRRSERFLEDIVEIVGPVQTTEISIGDLPMTKKQQAKKNQ